MGRLLAIWIGIVCACSVTAMPAGAEETVPSGLEAPSAAMTSEEILAELGGGLADEPLLLSMDFENAPLKTVLKSFSQQTGINVIAVAEVGDQQITVYLEGVTVLDALDQILAAGQLSYERAPGSEIYIVKPKEGALEGLVTRVYFLKYARVSESIFARAAAAFGERTPFEANLLSGDAGGGDADGPPRGVDVILRELLTEAGQVVVDSRTNRLIVTDVPDNFPRIEAALAALDIRTMQIVIDAELIETTLAKVKDLGLDWGGGTEGNEFGQFTLGSRSTRFPFNIFNERIAPPPTDGTGGSSPFTASTLSFTSFTGILRALETDTDTKVLARPKVLTLDNESAVIRLTTDETIGFEVTTQGTTGTTESEPERTTTGIVLVVTPQVNDDGYITMILEPSVTKTVLSRVTPPPGTARTRDPKTRSSRTLVRIRSGDTLVVGGLIDREEEDSVNKVPVVSSIPVIGRAFQSTGVNNTATELIIFVTPTILTEGPEARMASTRPIGLREQEADLGRQETIEKTLEHLE